MYSILAEWNNGTIEIIDLAASEDEANFLVGEYSIAFQNAVKRVWIQLG